VFKLRAERSRADKGSMASVKASTDPRSERGQAMVEFALIAPLFLMIVVGVIQFGVALNFWLDMQRVANQGARWAVVNSWPTCPRTSANTLATHPGDGCTQTLRDYLANQRGAEGENFNVWICFPDGTGTDDDDIGDPVKVTISQKFRFMAIVPLPGIDISGSATMRLEQEPKRYAATAPC
jgi:hypothetical protein